MAVTYKTNDNLAEIAKKVIAENENLHHLGSPSLRVAFQMSSEKKTSRGKTVFADTEKVKDKLKAILPFDFLITFYEPNVANLSEEKMEHLMYHELRHIGFKDGKFSIVPHDVEDFRDVVDKWGIDWI